MSHRSTKNKIRKIDATFASYEVEVTDYDLLDRLNDESGPRCSTPVISAAVPSRAPIVACEMSSQISSIPSQNSAVPTQEDFDEDGGNGILEANYLSDLENDADFEDDVESGDEANGELVWQRIISNECCKLSVNELSVLLATLHTVHRVPDTAMNAFCKLLSMCLPNGNVAPSSFSSMAKRILSENGDLGQKITYVCSSRSCGSTFEKLFDICRNSHCPLVSKKQHASGFLRLQIRPQIERIIRTYLADILQYISSATTGCRAEVGDIPSTPAYARLGPNPVGSKISISLILSSDGAQAFNLSRNSFWPCVAIIAELPPTLRSAAENCIGLGFWVGRGEKSKPDWDVFLPPIISELMLLRNGFDIEIGSQKFHIVVRLLATILDLPAQASVWGIKQFNGKCGCFRCLHPGGRLWPSLDPKPLLKDQEFYQTAWEYLKASSTGEDYFGVKKLSPLASICNPACVNIFDSMHLVYRGNTQLIINRLFTSQAKKWSAIFGKDLVSEIDCSVQSIRFPHYFNRRVPNLATLGSFKASELKNLLIYALLPLTAPYMDRIPDYWHWIAIYVNAIRLLSQPTVTAKDADIAQLLLDAWQKLIPDFCHESSQNFNSHAVLHLPEQVKQFGPLWSISTFAFEGFNGHFSRYIKASKGILVQLGRRFALQQYASDYLSQTVRLQKEPLCSIVKDLFPALHKRWLPRNENDRYQLLNAELICNDTKISNFIKVSYPYCDFAEIQFSKRASAQSEILHSIRYSPKTASIVKYLDPATDTGESYGEIDLFFSVRNDVYILLKKFTILRPTNVLEVSPPENGLLYSLFDDRVYGSFFSIIEKTGDYASVLMSDMICSAVLVESCGVFTVSDVLPFEHD